MNSGPRAQSDWKEKYLDALDKQERRERQQQQLLSLLIRAVQRISLVADGIDEKLDKQLAGLRQLLREGSPSARDLKTVVNALDGQVKRIDTVKTERAKVLMSAFQSLVKQLSTLKPEKEAKQQLKRFNKNLKIRSARMQEYSALINEYSNLQKAVLEGSDTMVAGQSFWQGWFSGTDKPKEKQEAATDKKPSAGKKPQGKMSAEEDSAKDSSGEVVNDGFDLSDDEVEPRTAIDVDSVGEEPPFSRLNAAICLVLTELLEQIEPPKMALENYRAAKKQIEQGLNWYELVPTLEDISIVVISAFDAHQKEFELFLATLNDRLSEAYEGITISQKSHGEGVEANIQLNASIATQVGAMQQSVADATELDQLKSEVSGRLDQIVAAMDRHQSSEKARDASLSEQLDALVTRVKSMESESAQAEQKIEEQRQKALRDVLTQLPNREAYDQRLQQEFERWRRYGRPLSLVVCDIDFFKRINDGYGHLAGDKVLRIIAKSLAKRLRKTDFIARYGGEEFVVLMPETEREQALKVSEGVREAIASCPFHFKDEPVSLTMSFGVCEFVKGDRAEQVFARADKALYQAKENGRNQCVLAALPPLAAQ